MCKWTPPGTERYYPTSAWYVMVSHLITSIAIGFTL